MLVGELVVWKAALIVWKMTAYIWCDTLQELGWGFLIFHFVTWRTWWRNLPKLSLFFLSFSWCVIQVAVNKFIFLDCSMLQSKILQKRRNYILKTIFRSISDFCYNSVKLKIIFRLTAKISSIFTTLSAKLSTFAWYFVTEIERSFFLMSQFNQAVSQKFKHHSFN